MGSQERKTREKAQRKQKILETAREMTEKDGWQAVSIRKIADAIEYSPPVIYEHFDSKEAILLDLVRDGFREFFEELKALRSAPSSDAEHVILQVALAYWRFAWNHQGMYQAMHGLGGIAFGEVKTPEEIRAVFGEIKAFFRGVAAFQQISDSELHDRVDLFWAMMHGLFTLTVSGRIAGGRVRAEQLIKQQVVPMLIR